MNDQNPKPNKPSEPPPPPTPTRTGRPMLLWVMVISLGVLMLWTLADGLNAGKEISIVEFWRYVKDGQVVDRIEIYETRIEGTVKGDAPGFPRQPADERHKFRVIYSYVHDENFQEKLNDALAAHNNPAKPYYIPPSWLMSLLPHLVAVGLVLLVLWFFVLRRMGAGGGGGILGNFGRSRHKQWTREQGKITFHDVAGVEDAKEEVTEIIEFLKNPRRFQRLGGRIPRGVLLVGEPGCGKTLLAKAIAGEADVPFFSISGSDFVEMFVGVGASRVRDLFKQAKDNSPCIIFLDEIDAVGRRRGVGFTSGGHDEREQTLNAILVEMDGFDTSDQVIVIAATNRMDVLDPALTRPGRFDRQIDVPLPDLKGRCEILKIYADKVKCGPDVDLKRLARGTPMFSGADLAALVNEAAIMATMADKEFVEQADLEEARDKVRWGRARKSRVIDEKEKEITAYHEAGHALVQSLVPEADPLHKVSIIPRGSMGGATFSLPEKDRYFYSRNYCRALLVTLFGGRLAEEIFCHDVSSGAANDIAQATRLARKMVLDWGMSDKLGTINYANSDQSRPMGFDLSKDYSEQTAAVIDQEVRVLIDEANTAARTLIEDHRDTLERIAQALLKYETLGAEEVEQLIAGKALDKPTVDDLLTQELAKHAPEPEQADDPAPAPAPDESTPPDASLPEPGAT